MKPIKFSSTLTFAVLFILFIYSCEKKASIPVLTTNSVIDITTTTATSGGKITNDGGAVIGSQGVCWDVSDNPTLDNNISTSTSTSSSFTSTLTQLAPATTYYARAYATNSAGTGYGSSVSFKTLGDKPLVTASDPSEILTTAATLNGIINPNSLNSIVTFEYGFTANYGNSIILSQSPLNGSSNVNVSVTLSSLNPGKTYHFRIKCENSLGITYSDDKTFTTLGQIPTINTNDPSDISVSAAKLNCSINPNSLTTSVIFEWGTDSNFGNTIVPAQSSIIGSTSVNLSVELSGLAKGTKYYYRITATNELGTSHSSELTFTTFDVPKVITKDLSEIKTTSALSGGNILSDFGSPVTERGICWSTSINPTISDNKIVGSLSGSDFSVTLTNLTPNSTYYLRAFAVNSVGVSYGNELLLKTYTGTISDIDGNQYYTVTIGNQLWMAQNLKTTKYLNGDPIGTTSPYDKDIRTESNPKYQWAYLGDEANANIYGRLYTWYTVIDTRNLCPAGWHVPTDFEWTILEEWLINNGYKYDGSTNFEISNKLGKSLAGTSLWVQSNKEGSIGNNDFPGYRNKSGFSALPAGFRTYIGPFTALGTHSFWWTSTEDGLPQYARNRYMINNESFFMSGGAPKIEVAYPVRCIKD